MMELKRYASLLLVVGALHACTEEQPAAEGPSEVPTAAAESEAPAAPAAPVTVDVLPVRETVPVASADDAADDPAIWHNAADPLASLVVGTDKDAGLNVYGLDGAVKSFFPAGLVNNVDLRPGIMVNGAEAVVVAASDRNDIANGVMPLYTLDTAAATLIEIVKVPAEVAEAYGICLYRRPADAALFAFINDTNGKINQFSVDLSGAAPNVQLVRTLSVATQPEGCVVDDRTGLLYLGEEGAGVWRFDAAPDAPVTPTDFARVDGVSLVADVEGMAVVPQGEAGGYLVVSSQGDNTYNLYDLESFALVGRFRIADNGAGVDGTFETDGLEVMLGDFGPDFPEGIFIAQDGDNAPDNQNFKYVSWGAVKAAMGLN
jgi:3-phytase